MNRNIKHLLVGCLSLIAIAGLAQKPKYQGQAPITIVPTTAKPVAKQWKGEFTFDEGSLVFSNQFEGARLYGVIKTNDSTYTALITSENTPVNPSPWYAFKVWSKKNAVFILCLPIKKEQSTDIIRS